MEYIYFFAFSAVIGIAVMLFAHISTNRKSARASGAWVDDTPIPPRKRTISGKTVEVAVRNILHGRPVDNVDALANPEALAHFSGLAELAC